MTPGGTGRHRPWAGAIPEIIENVWGASNKTLLFSLRLLSRRNAKSN